MKDAELARLVEAYLRDTITPEEFSRLEERLIEDAGARREFRRAANLDTALHDWAGRPRALDSWLTSATAPQPVRRGIAPAWFAAAAVLVCAAILTFTVWWPRNPSVAVERTAQGCAVLTQSAGATWSGTLAGVRLGDILKTGSLRLEQGLAQIEFFSGAKLVIEGPAEFHIVSAWEVDWSYGKARVHVPPAARGFQLHTTGMKLVDLGTEFGVEVNRATDEMHVSVFSGEVVAHPNGGAKLSLREGEGLAQRGGEVKRTASLQPDTFVNGNGLQTLSQHHAQNRFTAWLAASQEQAQDPRLIAYYPLHEIDSWNRIVRNAAASANRDLDGGAVGVSIGAGRWPEKRALEFKRPGDRVRLHIEGTYRSLTMAGWVKVDGLDRTYNALFLTDGYEVGEPHWQIYQDGRLMFSLSYPDPDQRRHNQIYYSPVVFDAGNAGRWHHIAVTYESHTGEVMQYMDGREVSREVHPRHMAGRTVVIGPSEIGNWGLPTQHHRFPIRNLNGSIDEFALYRAALSPAEIQRLYEAGKPE